MANDDFKRQWNSWSVQQRLDFLNFSSGGKATQKEKDKVISDYIKQEYGSQGQYLSHPELGPILKRAAREGWSQEKLDAAIHNTKWFKKNSETSRQYEVQKKDDPKTAKQRQTAMMQNLRDVVDSNGVGNQFSDSDLMKRAEKYIKMGLEGDDVLPYILADAQYQGQTPVGAIGGTMDSVRARAKSFGVPMSDQSAWDFSRSIAMGRQTVDGVETHLRNIAKSRYSHIAEQLEGGFTTRQILDPYIEQMGQLLEISPQDIDLEDARIQAGLDYVDSSSTRRMMTMAEHGRYLRSRSEWGTTKNGKEVGADVSEAILQTMGAVAR